VLMRNFAQPAYQKAAGEYKCASSTLEMFDHHATTSALLQPNILPTAQSLGTSAAAGLWPTVRYHLPHLHLLKI
jgi:hypothetical protein